VVRSLALVLVVALAPATAATQVLEREVHLLVLPVLGYSPETRLYAGGAVLRLSSSTAPGQRPTLSTVDAIYSQNRQFAVTASLSRWSRGNLWHVFGEAAATRFPFDFYGIGAAAGDEAEQYTPLTLSLGAGARRRIGPGWYLGGQVFGREFRMLKTDSAGALREGVLPGSADHFVATVGADISRDTRVEVFAPRAGSYVRVAAAVSSGAFGSDFDYRRLSLDARTYRSISPRRVIAAQAAAEAVDGTAPFDLLSRLGGQVILRGYQQARYSDNAKAAAQAELRSHVFWRVGVAVFGGLAAVAPSAGDLPDAPWLAAGGAGLRFNVSQAEGLNLRLDLAWGRRGSALYIGGGDAF